MAALASGAAALATAPASAQEGAPLEGEGPVPLRVMRALDAIECPDAAELAAVVNRRVGGRRLEAEGPVAMTELSVQITRPGTAFVATIRRNGARPIERVLLEGGLTCGRLSQRLVEVLAALAVEDTSAPAAERRGPGLALGGGGAHGMGVGWSEAVWGEADLGVAERWALRVGVAWLPERTDKAGFGRVSTSLLSAAAGLCFAPLPGPQGLRAEACARLELGRQHLRTSGFGDDRDEGRFWLAPGLGLRADGALAGPLRWVVRADVEVPLGQGDVSGGGGSVYDPSALGLSAGLGVRLGL
jgi:hypothetical protein